MRGKAITATKFAAGLCPNELRYNESSRKAHVRVVRVVITLKDISIRSKKMQEYAGIYLL